MGSFRSIIGAEYFVMSIHLYAKLPRGAAQGKNGWKTRPDAETINRAFAELLENERPQKCRVNQGNLKALAMKSEVSGGSVN